MAKPLSPLDKICSSIEAHRCEVKRQLAERLAKVDPYEFEHLVKSLLEKMSFTECEVTQQYKDGGIDLKANFSIGISEIKTLGQVKRVKRVIGTEDLQKFYGVMSAHTARNEVHLGLYVTTSSFAGSAMRWVDESNLPLVLIDGAKLVDLMVEYGLLVRQVPLPSALELALTDVSVVEFVEESVDGERVVKIAPRVARGRCFKWNVEMDSSGAYTLVGEFLPDPSQSFTITGHRVARSADFKPARTELQAEIVSHISRIFPELDRTHVGAKAWSGTHRIYPAQVYGK
ncbi:MAG: restriction endonuclease [Armatimonadia bacterium]